MGFPNSLTGYALELSDVTSPNFVALSGPNSALLKNFGGSLVASVNGGAYAPLGGTSGYPLGVRQIVNFTTGVFASGIVSIPRDNTIPQITEGDQFLSVAITPQSATSSLLIFASLMLSPAAPNSYQAALFRDSTANAIGCIGTWGPTALEFNPITLIVVTPSVSVAPTTFRVRAGTSTANTLYFNGNGTPGMLGGSIASGITVAEFGA